SKAGDNLGTGGNGTGTNGTSSTLNGDTGSVNPSSTASNSNLFDTSTSNDQIPATSNPSSGSITSNERACLVNPNQGFQLGGNSTGTTSANSCLNTSTTGTTVPIGASNYYNLGNQALGMMYYCYQVVAAHTPPQGADQTTVDQYFLMGELAEV